MRHLSSKILGKMLKYGPLIVLFLSLGRAASALEIPLKSSQGGGISVGYVDMEAVFQEYPETKKAKSEYYAELAKRRDDLAKREQELSALRQQLAILQGTLSESGNATTVAVPALPSQTQTPTSLPSLSTSSSTSFSTRSPSFSSTNPAGGFSPPSMSASSVSSIPNSAGSQSSSYSPPSVSSMSVSAANASVLDRKRDLTLKEQQLEQARIDAAKAVKDLEETRSLQILGKLYKAMVQLAEENNISLIVDKSSILYGHQAIDLTDKLSRRIRGLPDSDEIPK